MTIAYERSGDDAPGSHTTFPGSQLRISYGHASEGSSEKAIEDFYGIAWPDQKDREAKGVVIAIADGISGKGGGRIAAECAVHSVTVEYYSTPEGLPIPAALDRVIVAANSWLQTHSRHHPELEGTASTLSLIVIHGDRYCLAHIGDTRIYRRRDGELQRLTTDHVWSQRSMQHVVKRAIGLDDHVVMQYSDGELEAGDVFVLLSDGVWEVTSDATLGEMIARYCDPQNLADALVDRAVLVGHRCMVINDATAVVVKIEADQARPS